MLLGFSHSLDIFSVDGIHGVGNQLRVLTGLWAFLSVQEPFWDVVIEWSREDIVDGVGLLFIHFSGSLVTVDLSDFHGKDSHSSTDTSDLSKTEWSLLFTVDICVLDSKNMFKFVWVLQNQ